MKKIAILAATIALVLGLCCLGCSPSGSGSDEANGDSAEGQAKPGEVMPGSLIDTHQALGQDITEISEVSIDSCSACHDWDTVVASTEDYWEGLGQITDANPHASHATNAFACGDCHELYNPQVNMCNQCHIFETPEGWEEKDKTTTNYGITALEPAY